MDDSKTFVDCLQQWMSVSEVVWKLDGASKNSIWVLIRGILQYSAIILVHEIAAESCNFHFDQISML